MLFVAGAGQAGATLADLERAYNVCGDESKAPDYRLRHCSELISYIKSGHMRTNNAGDTGQFRLRDIYTSRAQVYHGMGKPEDALADLDEAISYIEIENPKLYDRRLRGWPQHYVYFLRAQVQIELKRYEDALASLGKADRVMEQGKFASDEERLKMASTISRTTGLAYSYLGQFQVGLAAVNLALEQEPGSAEAYLVRAAIYKSLGQMPQADADLVTAKSLAP